MKMKSIVFMKGFLISFSWISLLLFSGLTFADNKIGQIVESDHVSIRLERIDQSDTYPEDIVEKYFSWPSSAKPPVPSQGNTFIFIYLTITRIENIHLITAGGRDENSSLLFDEQEREHKLNNAFVVGMKFKDNTDFTSPSELLEGSKITLVFQAPKYTKPTGLKIVYDFKEKWEAPTKQSQINLKIPSAE
jgi:hypothetical protein